MRREKEMLKAISENFEEIQKKRMEKIWDGYQKKRCIYKKEVKAIWESFKNQENTIFVICYLRSSFVTRSHNFLIEAYQKEIFVEENPPYILYSMKELFDSSDLDIKALEKEIQRKFIRVFSCEIEEVRRYYMERIYQEMSEIFREITKEIKVEWEGNRIPVFYGERMGNLKRIGELGG